MTPLNRPVTRLTPATVRDGGRPRQLVATLVGKTLVLRCYGRRSEEVIDLESAYLAAIKNRKWRAEMVTAKAKAERARIKALSRPTRRRSIKPGPTLVLANGDRWTR